MAEAPTVFDYIRALEASRRGDSAALEAFKAPEPLPAPAPALRGPVARQAPVKPRQTGLGL